MAAPPRPPEGSFADCQGRPLAGCVRVAGGAQLEDLRAHHDARALCDVAREGGQARLPLQHAVQQERRAAAANFLPPFIDWDDASSEEAERRKMRRQRRCRRSSEEL